MTDIVIPPPPSDPLGSTTNDSKKAASPQRRQGPPPLPLAILVVILASCCLGSCLAWYWQLPAKKNSPAAAAAPVEDAAPQERVVPPPPVVRPEILVDATRSYKVPDPPRTQLSADALFQQSSPAVVKVLIQDGQNRLIGTGSGFLVSKRGLIVTNYHVIAKAQSAVVVFANKTMLPMQRIAAFDKEADVAVISVNGQLPAQPLELAGKALPQVGSKVFAIGYPLGLTSTLSDGLVSGHQQKNARITEILTNAAISPGSSGGPLLTTDGKVIGITTASFTKGQNLNIVVPSAYIAELLRLCE